ncbi:MAG: nitronate monooxygenase [Rhodobacteraceae bacterium]|nr:nitronate monooxygenase [Paracoccaceae bacterium]
MNTQIAFAESRVSQLLKCQYPILLAGMGGVARSELVAAVSNAGGFGFLGMVRESPALISQEISSVREKTERPFGVNLIPAATDQDLLEAEIAACMEEKVFSVGLFWDLSDALVRRLVDHGILVVCQVGSVSEAVAAQEAGAALIVAQGVEAGGHVRGQLKALELIQEVSRNVDVPIVAAGGISTGKHIFDAFTAGAEGTMIGTAFIATEESFAHPYHKQRIVDADSDATILTTDFHINWPRDAKVRVLRNSVTNGDHGDPNTRPLKVIGNEEGRPIYLFSTDSPLRSMSGDFEAMALYAGVGSRLVRDIKPAAQVVHSLAVEFAEASSKSVPVNDDFENEPVELASSPCYAADFDAPSI